VIAMTSSARLVGFAVAVQGAVFAALCSSSNVLVARRYYDLSEPRYVALFVPQLLAAAIAALLSLKIAEHMSARGVVRYAYGFSATAMVLLVVTSLIGYRQGPVLPFLITASTLAGAGVGLAVPALTRYVNDFSPLKPERSVIALNLVLAGSMAVTLLAMLGLEAAGPWWILPGLLAASAVLVIAAVRDLSLGSRGTRRPGPGLGRRAAGFRLYPAPVLVVAVCEVMSVAWPETRTTSLGSAHLPYRSVVLVASRATPAATLGSAHLPYWSVVLAASWGALVVFGRAYFAANDLRHRWRRLADFAPFAVGFAMAWSGLALSQRQLAETGLFVLAGLVCASLLPLLAGPAHEHLTILSLALAVGLVGLYPACLGIAHASLSIFERGGASIPLIFSLAGVLVFLLVCVAHALLRRWPTPAGLDAIAVARQQGRGEQVADHEAPGSSGQESGGLPAA
jgi:MFS family permease